MATGIVIVGYCASGKTSVVEALRERGVNAHAVAQEHSVVRELWNHQEPDVVVFLDVTLDELRIRRKNPNWPAWIYELQTERLDPARHRADLVIDTTAGDVQYVVDQIESVIADNITPD
jgi:deoxyadenosine/deoxycytidine kinase